MVNKILEFVSSSFSRVIAFPRLPRSLELTSSPSSSPSPLTARPDRREPESGLLSTLSTSEPPSPSSERPSSLDAFRPSRRSELERPRSSLDPRRFLSLETRSSSCEPIPFSRIQSRGGSKRKEELELIFVLRVSPSLPQRRSRAGSLRFQDHILRSGLHAHEGGC